MRTDFGTLTVGQFTLLQDLKQKVLNVRMSLFDFVKNLSRRA